MAISSVWFLMLHRFTDNGAANRPSRFFQMLYDSNTNVNSMINRRVSLFYRCLLEVSHHMVCLCTLYGVCVVCPGTSELVGQHQKSLHWFHIAGLTREERGQGKQCCSVSINSSLLSYTTSYSSSRLPSFDMPHYTSDKIQDQIVEPSICSLFARGTDFSRIKMVRNESLIQICPNTTLFSIA